MSIPCTQPGNGPTNNVDTSSNLIIRFKIPKKHWYPFHVFWIKGCIMSNVNLWSTRSRDTRNSSQNRSPQLGNFLSDRADSYCSNFNQGPRKGVTAEILTIPYILFPICPCEQGGGLAFFETPKNLYHGEMSAGKNGIPFNYGWFLKSVNNASDPSSRHIPVFISDEVNLIISCSNAVMLFFKQHMWQLFRRNQANVCRRQVWKQQAFASKTVQGKTYSNVFVTSW